MVATKYSLFQLMCTCALIDFKTIIESLSNGTDFVSNLSMVSSTIYGLSGFKNVMVYNEDSFFPFTQVGSVHIKCKHLNGAGISLLLFKSGKFKISGGFPREQTDVILLQSYIEQVAKDVCCHFTGEDAMTTTISMLNAQIKIQIGVQKFRKYIYEVQQSMLFHRVQQPKMSGRGSITNARVYPFAERNAHFAIDPNGKIQLFAFKSFDEIKENVEKLSTIKLS